MSRYGAMTVSWSYDKIGPMCRSAEDCALVLEAIHGPDPKDLTAIEVPFHWDARSDLQNLRVGYVPALLAAKPENEWMAAVLAAHQAALQTIADMGVPLIPLKHIDHDRIASLVRVSSLGMMVEAAAAHEELALHEQGRAFRHSDWAKRLRAARYIPAVDYVQANRARMLLMEEIAPIFETIDVLVGRNTLSALQSNLTGHPELVIPHGLDRSGMPVGIILTGKLFGEAELTRLAHAYQMKTDYHRIHPDL